jgi:hypothetical protein
MEYALRDYNIPHTIIILYDNPQYGLSKSQSFVVYSMLKISDVTDSGRQ